MTESAGFSGDLIPMIMETDEIMITTTDTIDSSVRNEVEYSGIDCPREEETVTKDTLTPSHQNRVLPSLNGLLPTTPRTPRSSDGRRYRHLYGELKQKYLIQQQSMTQLEKERKELEGKLSKVAAEADDWREKYESLHGEMLKMKENYEQVIAANAAGGANSPNSTLEFVLNQHQTIIQEKDANINSLKNTIKSMENEKVCCLRSATSDSEMFKIKPKASGKKKKKDGTSIDIKCEFTGCENDNIDLVKCNICEKWVCEDCNGIAVAKLKQVVDKCKNVFFVCQECEPNSTRSKQHDSPDMVTTLKALFDSKVCEVENKLVDVIEKKLGENREAPMNEEEAKKQGDTYAKVLAVPAEIKKMLREAKNDEKVEGKEMEKRAHNFIIHGAEEVGNGEEEIEKNDDQYIKDIMKKLSVPFEPEKVTRLGKSNERRRRIIKVEMKSIADKDSVISNLSKLKGSEEEFGKISITSDYTKSERDEIKAMSEKAKAQTEASDDRIFKVRGDPKNGLRIVSFARK